MVIFFKMVRISYRISASMGAIVDMGDRSTISREITFCVVDWCNYAGSPTLKIKGSSEMCDKSENP
jgi:hypothetical protein